MNPVNNPPSSIGAMVQKVSERIRIARGLTEITSKDPVILVGGMSRSGTTLLTTVLDSHPEIVCGAELLPPQFSSLATVVERMDAALTVTNDDFSEVGRYLRHQGERELGLFLLRCYRAGVTAEEVRKAFSELAPKISGSVDSLGKRLHIAQVIMRQRAERESAVAYGFKYTSSAPDVAQAYLPNNILLCIVRDPRDVVLSHQKRGFDRTVDKICSTWNAYTERYRNFSEKYPDKCCVIRYEDLVRQPRRTLSRLFDIMPVDIHPDIFDFYRSSSPIHDGFHPNAEQLRTNFSTKGIGLARSELPLDIQKQIEQSCRQEMEVFGYDNRGYVRRNSIKKQNKTIRIGELERFKQRTILSRKRKYTKDDYAKLLDPYIREYEIMPIGDYVRDPEVGDRKILMIRHDVDHDLENGIKIAKWESEHGIRATYCLLHTAWYYGRLDNGRYIHSDLLLEGIESITEYGHEINFHNNLISIALQTGIDPVALLESELEFYDRLGVPVTGTSTHGDALCHELSFRNWELFKECCDERFGGPRKISYTLNGSVNTLELGATSMFDLGLEYEAYDIAKDSYHTESGGRMRLRENTRGRRDFGRHDTSKGQVCGILTHPVWWDFN